MESVLHDQSLRRSTAIRRRRHRRRQLLCHLLQTWRLRRSTAALRHRRSATIRRRPLHQWQEEKAGLDNETLTRVFEIRIPEPICRFLGISFEMFTEFPRQLVDS